MVETQRIEAKLELVGESTRFVIKVMIAGERFVSVGDLPFSERVVFVHHPPGDQPKIAQFTCITSAYL